MSQQTDQQIQLQVRLAARALARANLVHAYGHCSQRLDEMSFLVCSPRPMGLIATGEEGTRVPVKGLLPEGVLGEVRIHQQIYAARPDVGAVCRTMPGSVMALSALGLTPRLRHGMGCYFHAGIPLWNDVQLVRTEEQALGVSQLLGQSAAVVMRGNGAVVVGADLPEAVVLTWYLEDAARIELQALACGRSDAVLSREEAERRAIRHGQIFERMWQYLTAGDPEGPEVKV